MSVVLNPDIETNENIQQANQQSYWLVAQSMIKQKPKDVIEVFLKIGEWAKLSFRSLRENSFLNNYISGIEFGQKIFVFPNIISNFLENQYLWSQYLSSANNEATPDQQNLTSFQLRTNTFNLIWKIRSFTLWFDKSRALQFSKSFITKLNIITGLFNTASSFETAYRIVDHIYDAEYAQKYGEGKDYVRAAALANNIASMILGVLAIASAVSEAAYIGFFMLLAETVILGANIASTLLEYKYSTNQG